MKNQSIGITEIIAAAITGMIIVAESNHFSLRHSIIGMILVLFLIRNFEQPKTILDSMLFPAIFALVILLTFGKLIDFIRDTCFTQIISRDFTYFGLWLFLTLFVSVINLACVNMRLQKCNKDK